MTPDQIVAGILLIGLLVWLFYRLTEGETPDLPDRWNK